MLISGPGLAEHFISACVPLRGRLIIPISETRDQSSGASDPYQEPWLVGHRTSGLTPFFSITPQHPIQSQAQEEGRRESSPRNLSPRAKFWKWTLNSPATLHQPAWNPPTKPAFYPTNPHQASRELEGHKLPSPRPGLALSPAQGEETAQSAG